MNSVFFKLIICISVSCYSQQNLLSDTVFVEIRKFSKDFVYDMKYATSDNFLKEKVYDCDVCVLRKVTVEALLKANEIFMQKGYRIKFFDCYRPIEIQQKMWKIVPDVNYVANPKTGSIHNRGGAVDITLVDKKGKELDMGTKFDHFGVEASHGYQKLSKRVLKNRKLLKEVMLLAGFDFYESEWWHYSIKVAKKLNLANFKWDCN